MKKIINLMIITLLMIACENTNETLVKQRGIAVNAILKAPVNTFRTGDFATSSVTFEVSLPKGETVDAASVQVVYNGKVAKLTDIASFPYSYSASGTKVLTALGIAEDKVKANEFFTFYVITNKNGVSTRSLATTTVKVLEYCPLAVGASEFIGVWEGKDGRNEPSKIQLVAASEADKLIIKGISEGLIEGWWGEEITERGVVLMKVKKDGTVSIPRQYIYTTIYEGKPFKYEIEGSGFWNNCKEKPHLDIEYDIFPKGESAGIGAKYRKGVFIANIDLK